MVYDYPYDKPPYVVLPDYPAAYSQYNHLCYHADSDSYYINQTNIKVRADVFCQLVFTDLNEDGTTAERNVIINKGDYCSISFFDKSTSTMRNNVYAYINDIGYNTRCNTRGSMDYLGIIIFSSASDNPFKTPNLVTTESITIPIDYLYNIEIIKKASDIAGEGVDSMLIGIIADVTNSAEISVKFINGTNEVSTTDITLALTKAYTFHYFDATGTMLQLTGILTAMEEAIRTTDTTTNTETITSMGKYWHLSPIDGKDIKLTFDCTNDNNEKIETIYLSKIHDITEITTTA